MIRFEDTVSVTMSVVFRKSAYVFRQFACLFVDLISVLTSALRYYGMLQRRRSTVLYGSSQESRDLIQHGEWNHII
ncbi:hypothetical protein CICLE_v10013253mg [Citrus x clementina]|uniref:Uncharacterized protein n=1 Tax=Citrus clementina TaxID=85681 RepID=V4SQ17_CITCL|nr:hypothetical protein CICLE_v10013253mg [Citrus x clementina]